MCDRTDYHTPQQAIRLGHSFQTNALAGIRERPGPTNPGSCHGNNNMSVQSRKWWLVRGNKYKLYPSIGIMIVIPLGMGSSVYTLPEVPMIGFVIGRTSFSLGLRDTSTATGWILKDSYG